MHCALYSVFTHEHLCACECVLSSYVSHRIECSITCCFCRSSTNPMEQREYRSTYGMTQCSSGRTRTCGGKMSYVVCRAGRRSRDAGSKTQRRYIVTRSDKYPVSIALFCVLIANNAVVIFQNRMCPFHALECWSLCSGMKRHNTEFLALLLTALS